MYISEEKCRDWSMACYRAETQGTLLCETNRDGVKKYEALSSAELRGLGANGRKLSIAEIIAISRDCLESTEYATIRTWVNGPNADAIVHEANAKEQIMQQAEVACAQWASREWMVNFVNTIYQRSAEKAAGMWGKVKRSIWHRGESRELAKLQQITPNFKPGICEGLRQRIERNAGWVEYYQDPTEDHPVRFASISSLADLEVWLQENERVPAAARPDLHAEHMRNILAMQGLWKEFSKNLS